MRIRFAAIGALAALALSVSLPAQAGEVALTFDDLPVFGKASSTKQGEETTKKLLGSLRRHHFVAIGFVNEIQLARADRQARTDMLKQWLDAGMELGNHSYSHVSLNDTPLADYIADVARGDDVTGKLLAARGRAERWYRYPYLETGPTLAAKQGFEQWLSAHGYRIAPVTMENSDWQFDPPYADALKRGDRRGAKRIRQQYIDYTAAAVDWYRKASVALLGREIDFVFLLHASRLNGDSIGALARILARNDLKVVSLDKAMQDSAYKMPDDYVGPDGNEWLERWSQAMHKPLPYGIFPNVPQSIVTASDRLDHDTPRMPTN
ncbi:Polysaccharide deacetylase [Sphingomonas sp. YR710]|uniref:polysaccharide deacetylase family protein n=1 Tax=Sphingomonas sp. YR710 TaxID=1882773 RepID=UPI00089213F4|nr:polysaccharide deacetylase family protein [Sphingomonas sp. YR710]SDC28309.1 Polysaccharide deacetylase [Sphingomonas sp. YR710]